ncbi:MAG: DUF4430 domain-containing protein [Actinobacteria bacterium]|nr:DUF4430 domain-containing protein [Actinomycetota bacterium]
MARRGPAVATLLLCGAALAAAGCGLGPGSGVGKVDLAVTREFGTVKVSESSGEANESDTVMRFLEGEDEIETRYGGGYVKSIDGFGETESGGHPYDWFFFVDGVESPVGAAEVSLNGGEKVWWDLHDWSASEQVPAVVGSWPAPFTTGWEGHDPVVAVECEGGGAACGTVEAALAKEGVKLSKGSPKGAIRVLVGPWAKVRSDPAAALVEDGPGESGVYADFEEEGGAWRLVGLDENGTKARTFGAEAGLVAATRRFEGPPVWVVTGGSGGAVRAAAEALGTADLRDHYAVASEAGTVTPLPLRSGSE